MTRRNKVSRSQSDYESFKNYLYTMHSQAVDIMNSLSESDKRYVEHFFQNYYSTQQEHYWTLMKLFTLAMYIPMFLQIGMSVVEQGKFDALIYVDTHAGPGIAKVGVGEDEIVLGSPLLAAKWPEVIAANVRSFRKIAGGFNELFFVEKEPRTCSVLRRIVSNLGLDKANVLMGDVNQRLYNIKKDIEERYRSPLILMFVDPYGKLSDQIRCSVFKDFVLNRAVDLVYNVMSPNIVRGLKPKNHAEIRRCIEELWGSLCNELVNLNVCLCYTSFNYCSSLSVNDVVEAFIHLFKGLGYRAVGKVPIKYMEHVLYHLLIASKAPSSAKWISNYISYLKTKAPRDYNTLKNLWLQVTGRQRSLFELIGN